MRFLKTDRAQRVLSLLALLVQIAALLLFPAALRQMVDIGVRQSGFSDAVPAHLREQTLEDLRLFMAPEDYKTAHDAYTIENGVCELNAGADREALNAIFAPAERYYLRTTQRGGNAMTAARAAMESGVMTQSQLLEQAKEGLNDLSPAEATAAAVAFLRAESSVLGIDPNALRTAYLAKWTWILIGAAACFALTGLWQAHTLRTRKELPLPQNAAWPIAALGALGLLIWALAALIPEWTRPGMYAMGAAALGQAALTFLPASLPNREKPEAPQGRKEQLLAALPGLLGAVGGILAVLGTARACAGATAVNAGLNRVLAASGGTDFAALRLALLPGLGMVILGIAMLLAARALDARQSRRFGGALRAGLEILPGGAAMVTALALVFARRFWLGVLLLAALAVSIGLMALVQNRRPHRVAAAVTLPGHIACAMIVGVGASLCAKSALDAGAYLTCVLAGLIFTRTGAKLLTRR